MKTLTLIRSAVLALLEAAQPTEVAISWGLSSSSRELPRVIVQTVGAGQPLRYIGMPLGWQGELVLRAQAATVEEAQAHLSAAAAGLPASLTIADPDYAPGWSLRLQPDRPVPGLTGPTTITVGLFYRAMLLPRST